MIWCGASWQMRAIAASQRSEEVRGSWGEARARAPAQRPMLIMMLIVWYSSSHGMTLGSGDNCNCTSKFLDTTFHKILSDIVTKTGRLFVLCNNTNSAASLIIRNVNIVKTK